MRAVKVAVAAATLLVALATLTACDRGSSLSRRKEPNCPGGCQDTASGCKIDGRCVIPLDDPTQTPVCVYEEALDGSTCDFGGGLTGQCDDGACLECTSPAACIDAVSCTRDLCVSGTCISVDECAPPCSSGCPLSIAAGCKVNGRCGGTVCVYDDAPNGTVCTVSPGTNGLCAAGTCVECTSAAHCNDNIGCTADACTAGSCVHIDNCTVSCGAGCPSSAAGGCRINGRCEGAECAFDNASDGSACTLVTGPGYCSSGACVQCLNDGHCGDGVACTVDACVAGFCENRLEHDGLLWRLDPPVLSDELLVSAAHTTAIDVEFNGTDFIVFMRGGGAAPAAKRVSLNGTVLDQPSGWTLPSPFRGAAFGAGKLMITSEDSDPTYGGQRVKYQFYSPEGAALGGQTSLDLDCRDPAWNCSAASPYFGGDAFLILYNKEWRTQYYALVDTGGGTRRKDKLPTSAQSGYSSAGEASYDGQKFVVAWTDYHRVSNSSDINYARLAASGADAYPAGGALTDDADQNYSNITPNVSGMPGRGSLVVFEGPSGQSQALDTAGNAVGGRLSGLGGKSALSEPLQLANDGTNYLVVALGADRVVGTRVNASGVKVDPAPFFISGADASREHYPRIARGGGYYLVAYTKRDTPSGVYARLVTTCP